MVPRLLPSRIGMDMSGLAVVAGATGYLGRHVVTELHQRGWRVRALARDESRLAPIRDAVDEMYIAAATDPAALAGLCDGASLVFSSLGITRQKDGLDYWQVDYQANRWLLDRAVQAGVRRFVFVSVLHGAELRDIDMVGARERLVDELRRASIRSLVVRPTGFFSDVAEIFRMACRGRVFVFGDGTSRLNPIHGADLAQAIADAASTDVDEIEVGGPDTFTQLEIGRLAFEALNRPPRFTHLPSWLVDTALAAVKPLSSRWWNIGSFMAAAGRRDMVAPATGSRHLFDFFQQLAREAS